MTRMGRAGSDTPVPRPSGARARPIPENTPHTDSTENTMNTNPWQLALHIDATGTVASAAHTTAAGNVETLTTPIDPRAAVTSAIEGHGRPPTELVIVHDGPPPEQLATALASDLGIPVELMTTAEALAHYRNRTGNGGPAESHPIVAFAGGDQYDASRVPPLGALVAGPGSLGAVAAPAGTQQSPGATTPPRPRSADAHPRATGRARSRTASILPASLQPYTRLVAITAAAVAVIVVVLAFAGMCSSSGDGKDQGDKSGTQDQQKTQTTTTIEQSNEKGETPAGGNKEDPKTNTNKKEPADATSSVQPGVSPNPNGVEGGEIADQESSENSEKSTDRGEQDRHHDPAVATQG